MIDHLNLLFINIRNSDLSAILEVFRKNEIPVNHQILSGENFDDNIFTSTPCDLIIISENDRSYSFLNQLSKNYSSIPIIYHTRNYSSEKAAAVMQNGAKDCISCDQIERLIPIVRREFEHKKIRDDLKRTKSFKEILTDITDVSTEEVYIFDSNSFKCIFINKTAARNCGYSKDETLSLKPADIYNEYDEESFTQLVSPLLNNKQEKISVCTNIKRKMGAVYPSETHITKVEKEKTYLIATNKDISGAWFKTQKLKRQRNLTNKYIQRHKEKKDLIANAAHDMRTSINSIILSNKSLTKKWKGGASNSSQQKFTQTINFVSNHLIKYIEEFFEDSDQIDVQNILLPEFGQKIYQTFKPVASKHDIDFHYNANNLHSQLLKSNPTYIKRILKNILSNAFKYTEKGSVSFNLYSIKEEEIALGFQADNIVAFEVRDTGIGIPEADQEQIFKRFSRAKGDHNSKCEGSGLGLDIAHELTQALGGKLHIDSSVDVGSSFTLFLPNEEPTETDSTIENQHHSEDPLQTPTNDSLDRSILVVDDSKVHNMAIKEFLSYTFKRCFTAQTPEEAYRVINQQSIDCVVLDYIIYDTNCLQIAQKIRSYPPYAQMPIIIYTGKKLNATDREALTKYADAIVQKNTGSYNKLLSTIYSFLLSDSSFNKSLV